MFEPRLPQEALLQMKEDFEGLKPVISENELKELCAGDEVLERLLESFLSYSIRYAQDVWSMHIFLNEGKLDTDEGAAEYAALDEGRTRLHNTLIDSIAILSRALVKVEKDNEWVRQLTNGATLERASCGAFALLLVYQRSIDNIG